MPKCQNSGKIQNLQNTAMDFNFFSDVIFCTKSAFSKQIQDVIMNSFKHFSAPKMGTPRMTRATGFNNLTHQTYSMLHTNWSNRAASEIDSEVKILDIFRHSCPFSHQINLRHTMAQFWQNFCENLESGFLQYFPKSRHRNRPTEITLWFKAFLCCLLCWALSFATSSVAVPYRELGSYDYFVSKNGNG